jgi:hypothetical protein
MLNVKNSVRRLVSNIYECQKRILINRRFMQEHLSEGNGNNTPGLQDEITRLQGKIIEFQKELRAMFRFSS